MSCHLIKGLGNSLSSVLGASSFDDANKDQCWAGFHASDSSFASDHQSLIRVVKNRYLESHTTLAIDPPECGIFTASDFCFGYRIKKLHKATQDVLRELDYQIVQSLASSMSGDDQRKITFCSTHDNAFANSFPLALAPEPSIRFNRQEFTVAMARKLGLRHRSHYCYRMSELQSDLKVDPTRYVSISSVMALRRRRASKVAMLLLRII